MSLKEAILCLLLKKNNFGHNGPFQLQPSFKPSIPGQGDERVLAKMVQVFLDNSSNLDLLQSSFHPGHKTETALVTLTDNLQKQLD